MSEEILTKLNEKLEKFKSELGPVLNTGDTQKIGEVLAKYIPSISSLCFAFPESFSVMQMWINSGEKNNARARFVLETLGVQFPYELGYIFLLGVSEEHKSVVDEILQK
ncbi:hypothetical protein KKD03_05260 [Patescibacteria group bacterium]|nr:hypothetical protein [Patescibacteria group bacterium]